MTREADLDRLYALLERLEDRVGGTRTLKDCDGYMDWPNRGVYFFFAPDETRDSSDRLRLTRIGTHAVSEGSQTSLWDRLRTHRGATRGSYEGGGNHRGSVFRKRVGEAIIERDGLHDEYPEWAEGSTADRELRNAELRMERRVSEYIRDLPFLWVEIDDEPGPESDRAYVERNAIALVSNFEAQSIDPRAEDWLGHHSPVDEIRESGLWNINHVGETYDSGFLDLLERYVAESADGRAEPRDNKLGSSPDAAESGTEGSETQEDSFEEAWEKIVRYAEAEPYVATLSRANRNEVRLGNHAIEVRNENTDEWREIDEDDFRYAFDRLRGQGRLTLDDLEPELRGRKSIVAAITARALELEYDSRSLTLYR